MSDNPTTDPKDEMPPFISEWMVDHFIQLARDSKSEMAAAMFAQAAAQFAIASELGAIKEIMEGKSASLERTGVRKESKP